MASSRPSAESAALAARETIVTNPSAATLDTTSAAHGACLELTELTAFANPDYFRFARPALSAARVTDHLLDVFRFGWGRLYLVAVLQKPPRTD